MKVRFTDGARRDLLAIRHYLLAQAGKAVTRETLRRLRDRVATLRTFHERGNVPAELAALGIRDYREVHEPPYRLVYRAIPDGVTIYVVADARRDFRTLLEDRLLR